jgi:pyruvate dehydrogenase E2 component (dihydrolipoamide acetyltransferase)
MDVESYEDGFLASIIVGDGEVASVGSPVGLLAKSSADVAAVQAYGAALKAGGSPAAPAKASAQAAPATATAAAPAPAPAPAPIINTGEQIFRIE